jgi:hypothetical protein
MTSEGAAHAPPGNNSAYTRGIEQKALLMFYQGSLPSGASAAPSDIITASKKQ